ncbi:hypothetical protein [Edaphobacter albus]|uniref:hypothetical protein n=1 Tax=Edaphobacter sp. 4G125 TaxID=2763071 RepID=UPI0016448B2A|nr:hypothetical protein [Edaphobacter sp. 4G125]QNI37499.1 hypothetical protein H7846_04135 [Edaphobacter sp. 4G125]
MAEGMELALDRILRAPETNSLAQTSGKSLTRLELQQVGILMEQTKNSYPAQEIPEETVEMWAPAWIALSTLYGISAMKKALQRHMLASRFFPLPSELREHLDALTPRQSTVYVPQTRREVAKLCGSKVAESMSEMTVEDVEKHYGAESAKRYKAKLDTERGGNGR